MRNIITRVTLTTGQSATTSVLHRGGRGQGFRLWEGVGRYFNYGADVADVTIRCATTDVIVDGPITVAAGAGKSGNQIFIPGVYYVVVDNVGAGGAVIGVKMDGDEGPFPDDVTVA